MDTHILNKDQRDLTEKLNHKISQTIRSCNHKVKPINQCLEKITQTKTHQLPTLWSKCK